MSAQSRFTGPKLLSLGFIAATLFVGILIGTTMNRGVKAARQSTTSIVAPDAKPLSVPPAVPIPNEFTKLAKQMEPSVVYIESDYLAKPGKKGVHPPSDEGDENGDASPPDILKHFFGNNDQKSYRTEGSGTGFVVDRNGYIITNNHVIDKADRIKVVINGEDEEYRGRVIGTDPETDIAVLKIDARKPLVPVQIGNSDGVEVGDWVVAIGSPFGLQATVTAGIVSATGRDVANQFQHFLQTDAAINPGNSGGPLLNTRGEVIGINTMIATHSGSYEGIGFALPSNMAVRVYNDIIKSGRVIRGSIGIQWSKAGSQIETLQGLGVDHGVLVDDVSPHGPGAHAGLKQDDIILSINDHPVKSGDDLTERIADMTIGSSVELLVNRDGKQLTLRVPVEDRSVVWNQQLADARPQVAEPPKPVTPTEVKFGITISSLRPKERQDLGIDGHQGVRVVSVAPGSFAEDIGLHENDAIIAINRQAVTSPEDIMSLQKSLKPGAAVAIHVVRSFEPAGRKSSAGTPTRMYLSGRVPED